MPRLLGTGAAFVKGYHRWELRVLHIALLGQSGYLPDRLDRVSGIVSQVISQKAKYALRALVALARAGDSMMIGEIAAKERIPRKFLEQILLELKRHGIVMSKRGKFGGYALLMPAGQITFGQVLRILGGPIA